MQKVFRTTEREPPERWHTIPREKIPSVTIIQQQLHKIIRNICKQS